MAPGQGRAKLSFSFQRQGAQLFPPFSLGFFPTQSRGWAHFRWFPCFFFLTLCLHSAPNLISVALLRKRTRPGPLSVERPPPRLESHPFPNVRFFWGARETDSSDNLWTLLVPSVLLLSPPKLPSTEPIFLSFPTFCDGGCKPT